MAYVYLHTKPNGEIFYVGKGSGYRAYDKNHRSEYWKRVVNKYGYEVKIFLDNVSDEKALSVEMDLIDAIGLDNLVNFTKGGEGISGFKHKEITKKKIGLSNSGGTSLSKGKKFSKSHRRKMAKSMSNSKRGLGMVYDSLNDKMYDSLTDYCKANNVNYMTVYYNLNGHTRENKFNYLKLIK